MARAGFEAKGDVVGDGERSEALAQSACFQH
jgi:hypothetical protein